MSVKTWWASAVIVGVLTTTISQESVYPNLLIPDGAGSDDPKLADTGSKAVEAFLLGLANTYVMFSHVEMKRLPDAMKLLDAARERFKTSGETCKVVKAMLEKDTKAKERLAQRKAHLSALRPAYSKVNVIRNEETHEWTEVMKLAGDAQLGDLVGLCVSAAENMQGRLGEYRKLLDQRDGPSQVASWRVMNEMEKEVLRLRYGAIVIEGTTTPPGPERR
jgi:hypothetical protein